MSPPDDPIAIGRAIWSQTQQWAHDHFVPLNVTVEITQRCNIRCTHCYNFDRDAPREARSGTGPDLSDDEVVALIGDLHAAGCWLLTLTGGEALLHPSLFRFLARSAELDMAVALITNGVLLRPGMVANLARFPNLLRVGVSLYGASDAVHDGITQTAGSFRRTWDGIRRLRDKGIGVKLKLILMQQNAHEVEAMIAKADAEKVPYGLDLTVTARHDGDSTSLRNRLRPDQLEALCRGPLRHLLPRGPERSFTPTEFACNCARGNCAVNAQGGVQPCISVPMVAGNIREQPFAEIWRSSPVFQRIRGLRVEDYPSCAPCGHKSWCTRERGAAFTYSGSYTGTDPLVCARAALAHELADQTVPVTALRRS